MPVHRIAEKKTASWENAEREIDQLIDTYGESGNLNATLKAKIPEIAVRNGIDEEELYRSYYPSGLTQTTRGNTKQVTRGYVQSGIDHEYGFDDKTTEDIVATSGMALEKAKALKEELLHLSLLFGHGSEGNPIGEFLNPCYDMIRVLSEVNNTW